MANEWTLVAEGLGFPEGPVVMPDGSVIVVEMIAGKLTRCWNGKTETVASPGGGPNGAAIGPDGALYVCNSGGVDMGKMCHAVGPGSEGRIERIDPDTGKVEVVYDSCDGLSLGAPNDLMFAEDGSFWFTDIGRRRLEDRVPIMEASHLFVAKPDGSEITCITNKAISFNGVGVSPDGKTVYVADTMQARVYAFDASLKAEQEPRYVATVPGNVQLDSLAMSASGKVCVGTLIEGGISEVSPDGTVTKPFEIDEHYVTNIAFGGEDMMDAYITCSTTGRLIHTRWHEPGMKLHF